jgi:hypothetical protein
MTSDQFQPLQLKGEIMDLEFTVDTDHRKRRRNRTTQSCLNCHTSKRKCDRKRPCQRCIQLGLTGLCVYEIDDPALRDDPTIDETTRLRNRIAELESLVRELRGKPHPRWAETSFRDGDPSEKWHSRATKCLPSSNKRRAPSPELVQDQNPSHTRLQSTMLTPIKTESSSDSSSHLFRFSPSPPAAAPSSSSSSSMRYTTTSTHVHDFQTDVRSPPTTSARSPYRANGSYHHHHHPHPHQHPHPSIPTPSSSPYSTTSGPSSYSDGGSNSYHQHPHTHPHHHHHALHSGSLSDGGGDADPLEHHHYSRNSPQDPSSSSSSPGTFCPCRTSPVLGPTYLSLSQQLENTLHHIRQYSSHAPNSHSHPHQCQVFRSILELNSLLQIDMSDIPRSSYDSTTPTDSEILTPLSASSVSGPPSSVPPSAYHHPASPGSGGGGGGGGGGVSPQEWAMNVNVNVNGAGYNPYFPVQSTEHGMYAHIVS